MPKKIKALSAITVARLKAIGRHTVGGCDGLHLRITAGSKTWIMRILINGIRKDMRIGDFPDMSLKDAREKGLAYRNQVKSGIDPAEEKRKEKAEAIAKKARTKTFIACAETFIKSKSSEWKNPKHTQQWHKTLETYAYPIFGKLDVADIELPHIIKCLEPIWQTKTETATRLRGRIESVLSYATVRGFRKGDNPARWRGHLDAILPAPNKLKKVIHHPAMPFDQLAGFMLQLKSKTGISVKALEFLILTATRSGEVRGATWQEIDLVNGVWTIPAERTKTSKDNRVPLSKQAIDLLNNLPRFENENLVFLSPTGKQLSDMSMTGIMRKAKLNYVPHGFRSSFRDWAGECTNYPRDLAEQALGHVIANQVEAAYRRGDALEKRRVMMQDWANYCNKSNK